MLDAVQTYLDLLTDDVAAESHGMLMDLQARRGLGFGNKPLCTVLRPRFLSVDQYRFLQLRVRVLMRAFRKVHEAALASDELRKQFGLTPDEETLVRHDPGFRSPFPTSRLDAFYVSDHELKFTEYNAETPAAPCYTDGLADLFYSLPVMGRFMRQYRVLPLPAAGGVFHALLRAYQEWCGRRELPRIAILDWKEVPTYSEFVLFDSYFRSLGVESRIVDPREVEYKDGKLTAGDYHITLIYKRVLISELLDRGGMNHPVVRAVLDGAVCMVNPFACKMLYKKASLAVLSDEWNRHLFNPDEAQVIDAHVPWTRVVEERKTRFGGESIDLVPYVLANRERFVLKPNDDYGGKGIVLGWTVDDSAWEAAVRTALATQYVVQHRVTLPEEPFPAYVDGRVEVAPRKLDTAPFVRDGEFVDGCLTRIASDPLLNVTAGGGSTVPTFAVEPRY